MQIASKHLKTILLAVITLIALILVFQYRTIQIGAFSLGLKVSELLHR